MQSRPDLFGLKKATPVGHVNATGNTDDCILFHFTSKLAGKCLTSRSDFEADQNGLIWFAEHPNTVCGEDAREVLLKVHFDLPLGEQTAFREQVVAEGLLDSATDSWSIDDCAPIYYWHRIPADFANSHVTGCSEVARDTEEWQELML